MNDEKSISNALDFMCRCYLLGLEFEDDGDKLIVRPGDKITEPMRFLVKKYKPAILRILKAEVVDGEPCKCCGWAERTYDGYCSHCIDLQVEAEAKGCEIARIPYAYPRHHGDEREGNGKSK